MIRVLASAILASAALLASTGVSAAPSGYYVATPAAAPAKTALITRSTAWSVQDGAYVAARAPERDAVLCELVVKSAGPLASFSAGGKAFDGAALGKCNAKANAKMAKVAAPTTTASAN